MQVYSIFHVTSMATSFFVCRYGVNIAAGGFQAREEGQGQGVERKKGAHKGRPYTVVDSDRAEFLKVGAPTRGVCLPLRGCPVQYGERTPDSWSE